MHTYNHVMRRACALCSYTHRKINSKHLFSIHRKHLYIYIYDVYTHLINRIAIVRWKIPFPRSGRKVTTGDFAPVSESSFNWCLRNSWRSRCRCTSQRLRRFSSFSDFWCLFINTWSSKFYKKHFENVKRSSLPQNITTSSRFKL